MAEQIQKLMTRVSSPTGEQFEATVMGEQRKDGTWSGWLEFRSVKGGATRRTSQETSQPNRAAVAYWASGLEAIYLDGALARSK